MTAIDPVCGMEVEESTAEWKSTYEGQTYYFCAPGCLRSFEKEPAKYAAAAAAATAAAASAHQHDDHAGHDHGEHAGHDHGHSHPH